MAAHYFGTVENNVTGRPVSGASVWVLTGPSAEGGTAVTLFSDESVTEINNPVTTNSYGFYEFYVADGHYTLEYAYNGEVRAVIEDVEIAESGAGDVGALELRMDAAEIVTLNAIVASAATLADPGADRLIFWDDSAGSVEWLTAGTGLTISGTSITVDPVAAAGLVDPDADRIRFWDDSAGGEAWLTVGSGLSLSGTTLTTTGASSGAITTSGLTMSTARLLGRTTASSGAVEEITVGSGLSLSAGVLKASQYILPLFFTTTPTASEVLLLHKAGDAFTIPANFTAALESYIGTNPTATFALTVAQNGVTIGTISVSTGGVVTPTTTSGAAKAITRGDLITITGPGTADTTAANMAFTIIGER